MTDLPIACTLDAAAMGERGARWEALAERSLTGRDREAGRATLRFARADGVADELRELVRLEGECCAFLDMRIDASRRRSSVETSEKADELVLTIAGPPEADALLDAFGGAARPAVA